MEIKYISIIKVFTFWEENKYKEAKYSNGMNIQIIFKMEKKNIVG